MADVFLKIVNMSISASWLVLAVLAFRLVFKKAPKWIHVLLWGIVAVRLICPFSIESSVSLVPDSVGNGELVSKWADDYIDDIDIHHPGSVYYDAAVGAGREPISDGEGGYYVVTKHDQLGEPNTIENTVIPVLSVIWVSGVILLAIYTAISYWRLHRKVRTAVLLRDNIFQSEVVSSPFVLGMIKPKIYLPFQMDGQNLEHVVSHEQAHIRRRDHWWKPLGFLLLTIHWFNPLMWLAYVLLCRDIELACDEKVVKELGKDQRADYSQALLACSVNRRMIAACPLAFGEVGVKERVKTVLNYKKPAFWIIVVAMIACLVVAACFLTNPKGISIYDVMSEDGYTIINQEQVEITLSVPKDVLSDSIYTEEGQQFKEKEVIVYQTDETIIFLDEVRVSNESKDLLYFTFGYLLDLPKSGTVIVPFSVIKDGASAAIYPDDLLTSDSGTYADAIHMRGEHAGGFAFYVSADACEKANGTMKIKGFCTKLTYAQKGINAELQGSNCDKISIQVINAHNYDGVRNVEVTDASVIESMMDRLQNAKFKKPLRKIQEAPDNLFADIALISDGKSFMRVLMLSSVSTGNEFEIYVITEDGTQYVMSDPLSISGGMLSLIESDGAADALENGAAQIGAQVFETDDVFFTYNSKQYDLSERNAAINEITDCFQIGEYLVLEGHTGPKHNVYCVFNTRTETFEADITGANLTWFANDINTVVYSYWSDIFTLDGRCLASYELSESEYIYSLEYSEDGSQIDALILSDTGDERTEIISPNVYIVSYSDLNHNRVNEQIVIRTVAPGQVYELAVLEHGEEIWKTEASPAHVGWNTILRYSEDGLDYLVQYLPTMFQGAGSYTCTVFSLEGNKQTIKDEWFVDFELGSDDGITETLEMTRFAERVNLLMRNSTVLLSTEQGVLVDRHASASALPQIYPVRFSPGEIQQAMEAAANPTAPQGLTANAAAFPTESLEFVFASGAGGWGTYLTLQPDGRFTGDYGDSDMDTRNECKFEGQFTDIQQISDYCWAMKLGDVTIEKEEGTTWTEDGIHYIASGPHGVSDGTDFLLYAPGTPADLIPAACRDWWPDAYRWRNGEIDILNGWGLCNLNEGTAFYTTWLQ